MCDRVDRALAWARAALADAPGAEPLDAPVLLAHLLGVQRAALHTHPERPLTPEQAADFRRMIEGRRRGVPVAYLTGRRAFFDREFAVSPAVLIPRPETEHLIEAALAWARGRAGLRIADVGTGSGAIAVTLAAHLPDAAVWAIDVSEEALAVARENAARAGVEARITWLGGDLLSPLLAHAIQVDLIAANLPYIPSADLDGLAVARFEPRSALNGGPDGLDLMRRLLAQAPETLAPGGLALLEIQSGQGARVSELAKAAFPGAEVRVLADYAGHDRVVWISTRVMHVTRNND